MGRSRDGIVDEYDTVTFKCRLIGETERALHLAVDLPSGKVRNFWIPKSQGEYYSDTGTAIIPEWLAEKVNI